MAKSLGLKTALVDALQTMRIDDFSGMLNSDTDPQDLQLNQSPDCQNVKGNRAGRLTGRDGYLVLNGALPAVADGLAFFYDANRNRQTVIWANGNIYQVAPDFSMTLIEAGVYQKGQKVCSAVLVGILYYSDGFTIRRSGTAGAPSGISFWDAQKKTFGPLISSNAVGAIPTPACQVMTTYSGALVIGNLTFATGGNAVDSVMWCNVLDPTTFIGTNIFVIGGGSGGAVNSLMPFSVSSAGVAPFKALFVGKNQTYVYMLQGALTPATLAEVILPAPVGVLDGRSVKYIPGPDQSGIVAWLGTDKQVWYTDGIVADILSKPIKKEIGDYVNNQIASSGSPIFAAVVNYIDQQYVLDLGSGRQYCYDYEQKTWTRYQGWPSGLWIEGKDGLGADAILVVDSLQARFAQCNTQRTDNGAAINPYWTTPYIHCGDAEVLKTFREVFATWLTDTSDITIIATVNLGAGPSASIVLTPGNVTIPSGTAKFDSGVLFDSGAVFAASVISGYVPNKKKSRMVYTTPNEPSTLLHGTDLQLKISQSVAGSHFELLSTIITYMPRGRKRVAL